MPILPPHPVGIVVLDRIVPTHIEIGIARVNLSSMGEPDIGIQVHHLLLPPAGHTRLLLL
jgi:hypothetical protein